MNPSKVLGQIAAGVAVAGIGLSMFSRKKAHAYVPCSGCAQLISCGPECTLACPGNLFQVNYWGWVGRAPYAPT